MFALKVIELCVETGLLLRVTFASQSHIAQISASVPSAGPLGTLTAAVVCVVEFWTVVSLTKKSPSPVAVSFTVRVYSRSHVLLSNITFFSPSDLTLTTVLIAPYSLRKSESIYPSDTRLLISMGSAATLAVTLFAAAKLPASALTTSVRSVAVVL